MQVCFQFNHRRDLALAGSSVVSQEEAVSVSNSRRVWECCTGSGLVSRWLSPGSYSLSALTADIRVRATSTLPDHTADAERAEGIVNF